MIIGDCPYGGCSGTVWLPVAGYGETYQRHLCEECGRPIWTRHSRIDPWSMTEPAFLAEYDVDEDTKQITPREP